MTIIMVAVTLRRLSFFDGVSTERCPETSFRRHRNPRTAIITPAPVKNQLRIVDHLLFPHCFLERKKCRRALIVRAATIPIAAHKRESRSSRAHKSNTARGNKNCRTPSRAVFLLKTPLVTDFENNDSSQNCKAPEARPSIDPIITRKPLILIYDRISGTSTSRKGNLTLAESKNQVKSPCITKRKPPCF